MRISPAVPSKSSDSPRYHPRGITHIGIVSDRYSTASTPIVIHNIGRGTQEEDVLFAYRIIGHDRSRLGPRSLTLRRRGVSKTRWGSVCKAQRKPDASIGALAGLFPVRQHKPAGRDKLRGEVPTSADSADGQPSIGDSKAKRANRTSSPSIISRWAASPLKTLQEVLASALLHYPSNPIAMLFWKFFRGGPTDWVCKLSKGKIKRQGLGLSFYYLPDFHNVVSVPTGVLSSDFHFEERSSDYQTVHVQGILTWRLAEPSKTAQMLDFSVNAKNQHISEDPRKLDEKLQNLVAVLGRRTLKDLRLEDTLKAADVLGEAIRAHLKNDPYCASIGIEGLSVEILSIKPDPEVGRALEAATREQILKQSDDATAQRRLSALENEKTINEREASNELAKDKAARLVAESRENHATMEQKHAIQLAERKQAAELTRRACEVESQQQEKLSNAKADAAQEDIRMQSALDRMAKEKDLADGRLNVARKDAEAEKARTDVLFAALKSLSADQLQALAQMGAQPGNTIAHAFQKLAERAGVIGQLNISPELLQSLLQRTTEPISQKR